MLGFFCWLPCLSVPNNLLLFTEIYLPFISWLVTFRTQLLSIVNHYNRRILTTNVIVLTATFSTFPVLITLVNPWELPSTFPYSNHGDHLNSS